MLVSNHEPVGICRVEYHGTLHRSHFAFAHGPNVVQALSTIANNGTKVNLAITIDIAGDGPRFSYGPQYANREIPTNSTDQVINYYNDPAATLSFDANTAGLNVPLQGVIPGLDHRNIDNTLVGTVNQDVHEILDGGCAVSNAASRNYRSLPLRENGGDQGGGTICR